MTRIWYTLLAVLIFSGMAACQAAVNGIPLTVNTGSTGGSVLALNITQPQDESVVRSNPVTVSGNVSSGAEVMINGLSVNAESGHFSVLVEIETGPNSIEITASDTAGKQVSKYVSVVYVP
jgi:hypothetical protein